ncbi:hypothetical protein [Emticicia agri]|uniref:Lipocalin-like domain-containing protein n=1 Tax=Emticicia agri TaxID=2492393 RepID=A0A4Q5LW55_9BACT|nr:hypothetical protein [Emticicia agri]RYU93777.1 hypothetical protein EWM59_20435 [Emticicia agri]
MKTYHSFNRFFAYAIVFSMLFLYSCKDKESVEPSMADEVTGNYNVSSISQGGLVVTLPMEGLSGEYSVSKINDSKVKVSYVLKSKGYPDEVGSEDATLTKASNGGIDFHTTEKVGNFANNTITFEFTDENGDITIVAKKK